MRSLAIVSLLLMLIQVNGQPLPIMPSPDDIAIPTTRFHIGQVLGGIDKGYTITLSKNGIVARSFNKENTGLSVMIGYEVSTKIGKMLQFKTYGGPLTFGVDTTVGKLEYLEDIRVVRVMVVYIKRQDTY